MKFEAKRFLGVITGISLSVALISTMSGCNLQNSESKYSRKKINQLEQLLDRGFLGEIDQEKVLDNIYIGYVSGLEDVDTLYLNEDQFRAQKILQKGQYIGTGIKFAWGLSGNHIIVTEVVKNSPADREQLKVGDKITEVDGIPVRMANQVELYEKISYTGDEKITYIVENNEETEKREVKLASEVIDISAMDSKILDNNIAYIAMDSIKDDTSQQLEDTMVALKDKGSKGFIIDLRDLYSNNLEEVYKLCDLFIEDNLVFKVKDKAGNFKEYTTQKESHKEKIVLLINGNTRGAIEAFVSAMQDIKQTVVVGQTSSGNGVVSEVIDLEDGTGVMVTTGIIHDAAGKSLKGEGVSPQIVVKSSVDAAFELLTIGKVDTKNDAQLMEALKQFS